MRLFETLVKHGGQPALLDANGVSISYSDLAEISDAGVHGIGTRQLVFCLCSNAVSSIIGYVGLVRQGHVCVMLPSNIELSRLETLIGLFQPNYIFASAEVLGAFGFNMSQKVFDYGFARISKEPVVMHPDLSLLMTTSGSTGSPRLVRISNSNSISNAGSIIESLSLRSTDRALTTLPMNYTYGLSIINSQLQIGGSLVVSDATIMDREFWTLVMESGATYFGGVPYTYQMLQRLGLKKLAGSNLRMLTQAGGKLDEESVIRVHSECASLGIEFNVMYGQTEATARISVLKSDLVPKHPWSIGHAISGGKLRVVNTESGMEVSQGVIGELEYSGPNVAMGYAGSSADLSREAEFGDTLRTGDLAVLEEDGFLRIVGRRNRFVKIFGNRVNLDDVEEMVIFNGLQAACTGIDDKITVHVIHSGDFDSASLQNSVAKFIGVHKNSIEIKKISKIPRSESGKVLYSVLMGGSNDN